MRERSEIPEPYVRLVRICIAALPIDRAEDRLRIIFIHECTRAVIDRLAGDRHIVRVHHAVNEADEQPLRDQLCLRSNDRIEERAIGLPGFRGGWVMPCNHVIG